MGDLRFELGEKAGRAHKCNEEDLARVEKAIFEAGAEFTDCTRFFMKSDAPLSSAFGFLWNVICDLPS